ncbi:hypothetical protein F4808DRAFT_451513 [Astrocystis sublimbata]|nr:hypothetical protein F4808DRAFT_451513 [Astrocystis sublimbata]
MTGPTLAVTVSPAVESTPSQSLHSSHPSPSPSPSFSTPPPPPSRSPSSPSLSLSSSKTKTKTKTKTRTPVQAESPSATTTPTHLRTQSLTNTPSSWTNENDNSHESPAPASDYSVPVFDFDVNPDVDFNTALAFGVPPPPPPAAPRPRTKSMGRTKSIMLSRPQSWISTSRSSPDLASLPQAEAKEKESRESKGSHTRNGSLAPSSALQERSRNVSSSIASFARRSWNPSSRSPSPNLRQEVEQPPEERPTRERAPSNSSIAKLRKGARNRSDSSSSESSRPNEPLGKIGNLMNKMKVRPQTARVKGRALNELESSASSTTSLAPPSTETRKSHASETSNSTFPEDAAAAVKASTTVRDPLWSQFKSIEADFQRFQLKPTAYKLTVIRTSLVPFLQKLASHPFVSNLHHEDLERRAMILNKWWTGLLEMLHASTHPPVPGVDRPALLDAVNIIMMRPEWRQSTPTFRPLADRNPQERTHRRSQAGSRVSTSSLQSTDSAYLAESAGHNVRNMFIANLMAQMALIVEKMSMRHVPHSLVNFAGKACAYAFFFAPGIADILVRLWGLGPRALRRMADGFKLPRRSKGESDDIVALFPPGLSKLAWTSVTQVSDALRTAARLPLASTKIPWNGPWVTRWNGRDSDLFFVFCKYYFILAESFMPSELSLTEKARAPGFVLVNAQILSVLDSTLHRQAAAESTSAPPLSEALQGADTSATALHLAPSNNNIMRGMSENRLVVLLKNMLSDTPSSFADARYTFAESFLTYDHNACFTICDFHEEVLPIYEGYVACCTRPLDVDWPFWVEVWKRISGSNNSMSEIRVLSLIFSIWETIASDSNRKEVTCSNWLLTEATFDKLFNNWCPMVRAYYMRLLCWRICRDAGETDESDARVFMLVYTRLKTVWSHYLWLRQDVEQQGKVAPSTAPSFPTPGKRFMIIRTEAPFVQPGFVAGFDTSLALPRQDMLDTPPTDFESIATPTPEVNGPAKKTWGLLGKVFSFNSNVDSANANDLEALRRETAASRTSTSLSTHTSSGIFSQTSSDTDSIGSSPTFEATQYIFKFILSWNNAGTMPPPNRILTRPRLPSPAQWIIAHGLGESPPLMSGLPTPTRAVSGSVLTGLVASAKNAESLDASTLPTSSSSASTALEERESNNEQDSVTDLHEDDIPLRNTAGLSKENLVSPVKPTGSCARSVKYAGRALAEWSLVVAECNNFVERRREEGILGLEDVEVPALGVEGFRKIC